MQLAEVFSSAPCAMLGLTIFCIVQLAGGAGAAAATSAAGAAAFEAVPSSVDLP